MNGRSRYLYAPAPVNLTPSVAAPLLATAGVTNGTFKLQISGFAGQTVVTEASTNLGQWSAIATNIIPGEGLALLDVPATEMPARFFRAVLRP